MLVQLVHEAAASKAVIQERDVDPAEAKRLLSLPKQGGNRWRLAVDRHDAASVAEYEKNLARLQTIR